MKSGIAFIAICIIFGACCPSAPAQHESEIKQYGMVSSILGREVGYLLYLPRGYAISFDRYPVVYFLPGMGEGVGNWEREGCREALDKLIESKVVTPLAVVIPETRDGFMVNAHDGSLRYKDFFITEFVPHVERHWRVGSRGGWTEGEGRDLRAISGVSSGGMSALLLAFTNTHLFSAVSAHAPFLPNVPPERFGRSLQIPLVMNPMQALFGRPSNIGAWEASNPITVAQIQPAPDRLAIMFDSPKQDRYGLTLGATELSKALERRNVRHTFSMEDGDHDWRYFAARIPESLRFHSFTFIRKARERGELLPALPPSTPEEAQARLEQLRKLLEQE